MTELTAEEKELVMIYMMENKGDLTIRDYLGFLNLCSSHEKLKENVLNYFALKNSR